MNKNTLQCVCEKFEFVGLFRQIDVYGDGHINDTYKVIYEDKFGKKVLYILQRVNHKIFKETEKLMINIENITTYLSDRINDIKMMDDYQVLKLIKTKKKQSYYHDEDGNYWRAYDFVLNATGHSFAPDNKMLYAAGKAFGQFQMMLKDYPVESLYETIPDFHHTPRRYDTFIDVLVKDEHDRSCLCLDGIEFVKSHKNSIKLVVEALKNHEIPLRVTHNDTKLNNVLIDDISGKGKCVIDLDTVMPGSALYDFGDAIRSCASTVAEDEEMLHKLEFDTSRFEAYSKGFLEVLGSELTQKEIELLPYSAILMTFECGMRFLTDYLDGDKYFKIHKSNHNLIRARNQFKFVEKMENSIDEMVTIIKKYCQQ